MPTTPPSSQPTATTVTSMRVRTSRIERPVTRERPVISPSRGPGPNWEPMYIAEAAPLRTTPPSMSAMFHPRCSGWGRNRRVRSSEGPMSRALRTVPMPGCCRSGIQMRSTTKDSRVTMVPKVSGTCLRMPEWRTSQGIMPRPAVTIIAMEAPKR
jgi:hypothetical protein